MLCQCIFNFLLTAKETEISDLKEALSKSSAERDQAKLNHQTSLKKLDFTQKATEKRLLDSISNPEGFHADPVLIGVFSATLDEEEVDHEETKDTLDGRSRKDNFLKSMEEKIDPSNPVHKERFLLIKNQILEKVKTTQHSRLRSRSRTGSNRSPSTKRDLSLESKNLEQGKSPVRPKMTGIPIKK